MTPQQILAYIRQKTHVTVDEMSDDYMYELMSGKYHALWQEITLLDENYGTTFWDTNVLAGVNLYPYLQPVEKTAVNTAAFGQLKVEKITIKYSEADEYGYVAQRKDRQFMTRPKERYEKLQSKSDPFFIISDHNIYIYPKPQDVVNLGLTMYGVKKPYNLNQYTTNISDILIEPEYHDLIALATIVDVYRERQRVDLAQEAETYYDREKNRMVKNISIRALQPMQGNIPDLRTIDMISTRGRRY